MKYAILFSMLMQPLQDNPIAPCPPSSRNCVLEAFHYDIDPSGLSIHLEAALQSLSPETLERDTTNSYAWHAVYKVWLFRDDVDAAIISGSDQSTLYLRSASRVGTGDLGVNRRRVKRIVKKLNQLINKETTRSRSKP